MANPASDDDFRLRCRSALTHPVTAAALPLTALGAAFGAVAGFRFEFSKPVFLAFAIILALAFAWVLNRSERRNSPTER